MRTMYDSVNAAAIPADAALVAGYVDGRYAWPAVDWLRFPHAVHVPIAVFASTNAGIVLDCENGDATPGQCPGWVRMRRAAGVDPTVYCSYSAWSTVRAAFAATGEPAPHYWIAGYPDPVDTNGNPIIPAGAVAHQWIDRGPYDESIVAAYWPGVDPTTPAPREDNDMGNWFAVSQGGKETGTGVLLENGAFLGQPMPASVRAARAYSDLNEGATDEEAMGRWNDLVTRFAVEAKQMAPQITVAITGQPPQTAQLNPSTGHYELTLVPDAPATTN